MGPQTLFALLFEFRVAVCFLFFFGNLSRFALVAFLQCCRLLCFPRVFHSILHYWEGIRLFTTLSHLL